MNPHDQHEDALVERHGIYQFDDDEIKQHPIVERLLIEARADERERIAAALLSDGAVVAGFRSQSSGRPNEFEMRSLRTKQMAALTHIGITEDES